MLTNNNPCMYTAHGDYVCKSRSAISKNSENNYNESHNEKKNEFYQDINSNFKIKYAETYTEEYQKKCSFFVSNLHDMELGRGIIAHAQTIDGWDNKPFFCIRHITVGKVLDADMHGSFVCLGPRTAVCLKDIRDMQNVCFILANRSNKIMVLSLKYTLGNYMLDDVQSIDDPLWNMHIEVRNKRNIMKPVDDASIAKNSTNGGDTNDKNKKNENGRSVDNIPEGLVRIDPNVDLTANQMDVGKKSKSNLNLKNLSNPELYEKGGRDKISMGIRRHFNDNFFIYDENPVIDINQALSSKAGGKHEGSTSLDDKKGENLAKNEVSDGTIKDIKDLAMISSLRDTK